MDWITLGIVAAWTFLGYLHGRMSGQNITDKELQKEYYYGYSDGMTDAALMAKDDNTKRVLENSKEAIMRMLDEHQKGK